MLGRFYIAVAWQRVDQIRRSIYPLNKYLYRPPLLTYIACLGIMVPHYDSLQLLMFYVMDHVWVLMEDISTILTFLHNHFYVITGFVLIGFLMVDILNICAFFIADILLLTGYT
jgi:hypothetical protein